MSRIGRKPVVLPKGVTAKLDDGKVFVKGPKGELTLSIPPRALVALEGEKIIVTRNGESRFDRAQHGLTRALIENMVRGVAEGFKRELDIVGVGYRAELKGKQLQISLGFTEPVLFDIPQGIQIQAQGQTRIVITGCDKSLVGETAARIRALKPPEPYQGKGIRYVGEVIKKKVGKAAAGAVGA